MLSFSECFNSNDDFEMTVVYLCVYVHELPSFIEALSMSTCYSEEHVFRLFFQSAVQLVSSIFQREMYHHVNCVYIFTVCKLYHGHV
jgi:hypothetical protein